MEENLSREARAATATRVKFQYSPAFISADDAARYVHERIGRNRTVEYGSVILRRLSDNRIFATEPIPGKSATFDFEQLLERGPGNAFLDPPGYKLVGGVHSHPAQFDGLKRSNPRLSERQVRIFNSFFSERDVVFNHYEGRALVTAYLSGPGGELLKYQPSFALAERQFVDWIDDVKTALPAHGHDGSLEGFIKKLASVGRLSLLVASADWGGMPGVIDERWEPYLPLVPTQDTVACGPLYPDVTKALDYAQTRMRRTPDVRQMVMLLKHEQSDEFAATQALVLGAGEQVPADARLPSLTGGPLLPEGFHVHGFFFLSQPLATQVPTQEPWLYRQFFSPGTLAAYIAKARRYQQAPTSALGISLYMRTPDNALLRYRFSGSPAESQLLTQDAAGGVSDQGNQQALDRGTLTPRQFVIRVAAAGELSVEQTSPLWDVEGVVESDWAPYSQFRQPVLTFSEPFATADEAALHAHGQVGDRRAHEVGALILKRPDQRYVVTSSLETGSNPYGFNGFYPWDASSRQLALPDGYQLQAWFGSHVDASQLDLGPRAKANWSSDEVQVYAQSFTDQEAYRIHQLQVPGYLSAAQDSLIVLEPNGTQSREFLSFFESLRGGSLISRNLADGTYTPADAVRKLAEVSRLRVVQGNRLWGAVGPVGSDWVPFKTASTPVATVQPSAGPASLPLPALSPAFVNPDDAARWAHNQIGTRRDNEYGGLILKRGIRYFATQPVIGVQRQFDFQTILAVDDKGHFIAPQGYECHGLYHSHPTQDEMIRQFNPGFTPDQVELFNSFYSNADQVFTITNRDFARVHYLSGTPNSLLKYVSSGSAKEAELSAQLMGTVPVVPFTAFEGAVWRLAQAGELRVVVPSRVWGGVRGKVSQQWTLHSPVTAAQTVQAQPFFTPLVGTAQAAVLVALSMVARLRQTGYQGVVLKHLTSSSYIATEPTALGASLTELFPVRNDGQPRLPSNFRLVGFYYVPAPLADTPLPATESWLYKRFVSPQLLVTAMNQAKGTQDLQIAEMGLKLFFHTADKALLQWQAPEPRGATELFSVAADGTVTDNANQAGLMDGSLSPRAFVRRLIRAGELTVLQAGQLWSTLGTLYDSEVLPLGLGANTVDASFLNADDAARHAHERIGVRRDAVYAGYILRRPDQRFVFTEPARVQGDGFAGDLLVSLPANGLLVPPTDYVIHGRYSSHPPLSQEELARWRRQGWSMTDLEISATMFNDRDIRSVILTGLPAYLSGSPNSLISYIPSGSPQEQLVLANANRTPGVDGYYWRLERGALKPENIVTRLAAAGELRVLAHTRLWGPRLRVYDDWTPNFDYAEAAPQTPALSAVFKTLDAAAINTHVRGHGRNLDSEGYTAYLLKHPQKNEYVVSELAPQVSGRWLSDSSLGAAYLNGGDFTQGFVLVGLFYSQQWIPSGLPSTEAWLTRFFATPQLLQRAERDARALSRNGDVLPVYLSTLEGALLRYRPPATSLLSGGENGDEVSVQGMNLRSGTLDIRRYVALMAKADGLTVLYSSQCWDRRGAVSSDPLQWRPYAHFNRRRLGPVFNDQDDAARYARSRLSGANARRLYGGLILKRPDGLFVATEPVIVPREDFDHTWIFPDEVVGLGGFPAAHTVVARYRSSPGRELPFALDATQRDIYRNMLSTRVIGAALTEANANLTREYLFGSDGCILSYSRSHSPLETTLKDDLRPLNLVREDRLENKIEQQIRTGTLKPEEYVLRLSKAGRLRVVDGSKVWGMPRLQVGFVPNAPRPAAIEIENAQADPPFSPVFAQETEAVRYAHEHCQYGSALQFGYVFKAARKRQFMVTMPLVRNNYWKFGQVFPGGLLPQGYVLEGIYLCAALEPLTPGQDPHERTFHSPMAIDNGMRFSRQGVKGKTLSLYLSCPEGALIQYQYEETEERLDSRNYFPALRQQLQEGKISVLDYVRDLARHGNLNVLVEGTVWAGTRRITPEWTPGTGEGFFDYPMGCGPLFSHPDDAARYVQRRLSARKGANYVAAVLANPSDTSYITTLPLWPGLDGARLFRLFYTGRSGPVQPVPQPTSGPISYPDFPDLYRTVGAQLIYRDQEPVDSTASKDEALTSHFIEPASLRDFIRILTAHRRVSMSLYLATRGGALLKYMPGFSVPETQLMASLPGLKPVEFLDRLTGVGQLSVLDRDAYWQSEGLISGVQKDALNGAVTDAALTDDPLPLRDRDEL
jgi:hypothetical protein